MPMQEGYKMPPMKRVIVLLVCCPGNNMIRVAQPSGPQSFGCRPALLARPVSEPIQALRSRLGRRPNPKRRASCYFRDSTLASAAIEGETGLLVPPHNVDALVTALNRRLSDPALLRRMGEAGRQRVDKYFTMDPCIKRVLGTLPKAIDCSREKLTWLCAKENLCVR